MADDTTTETTEVQDDTTTTTTEVQDDTTTTTTEVVAVEEVQAENSPVLGDDNQTHEDRLESARRDALVNAQGEQDLNV